MADYLDDAKKALTSADALARTLPAKRTPGGGKRDISLPNESGMVDPRILQERRKASAVDERLPNRGVRRKLFGGR